MNSELAAADPGLVGNDDLLRGILAGCGDCIKVLDLDGRLQFMSEGGKRVMEVEDFSKFKGCPWPDFWKLEGHAHANEALRAARAGRTAAFRGPANTAQGNAKFWDVQVSPIFGANGEVAQILSISRDITEQWQAADRIQYLAEELAHRAKNSFAMVISIAKQTFRGKEHANELKAFTERIVALAKAHEISSDDALVRKVVENALAPYRAGEGRFKISGSDVKVNARQALSLTLAVNELATNAIKYGALSAPEGSVDISWNVSTHDFIFVWQETGGPVVSMPTRTGFGTRVIRDILAIDLGGKGELDFDPKGLLFRVSGSRDKLPA